MTTLILETEPLVIKVTVTDEKVIVDLADGRSLSVPLAWGIFAALCPWLNA